MMHYLICGEVIHNIIYRTGTNYAIFCYANASNNVLLKCENNDNNCTFYTDCDFAEYTNNCLFGYQLPTLLSLPTLVSVAFSTQNNSNNICDSDNNCNNYITYCNDYGECNTVSLVASNNNTMVSTS